MENVKLTCPRCNQTHFYYLYASNVSCRTCGHSFDNFLAMQKEELAKICSPFVVHGTELLKYNGHQSHVRIPSGITKIAPAAFFNCKALESLVLPKSLEIICSIAFENCTNLKTVSFESFEENYVSIYTPQLSEICSGAFRNCTSLIDFPFLLGLLTIGQEAFANCKHLKGLHLPNTVEYVWNRAFVNCSSFNCVHIMGATRVCDEAFMNCTNIASVKLYGHLTKGISLSKNAFKDCVNLTSVIAADTDYPMPYVTKSAFNGCKQLHTVCGMYLRYFSDDEPLCHSRHEKLYYMELRRKLGVCQYCGGKFKLFSQTCRDCGKKKDY